MPASCLPPARMDAALPSERVVEFAGYLREHGYVIGMAETSLQLKEVPTANTERYDSLRGTDATKEISHA